jgi:hypothetical protein
LSKSIVPYTHHTTIKAGRQRRADGLGCQAGASRVEFQSVSCPPNGQRSPAAAHDHVRGRLVQRVLAGCQVHATCATERARDSHDS